MGRVDCLEHALPSGDFEPLADAQKSPRIESGADVANDIARAEAESQSEAKGRAAQHETGDYADDRRVDFELADRHHGRYKHNQARDGLAQRRREVDTGTARRLGDKLAGELAKRASENDQ